MKWNRGFISVNKISVTACIVIATFISSCNLCFYFHTEIKIDKNCIVKQSLTCHGSDDYFPSCFLRGPGLRTNPGRKPGPLRKHRYWKLMKQKLSTNIVINDWCCFKNVKYNSKMFAIISYQQGWKPLFWDSFHWNWWYRKRMGSLVKLNVVSI